MAIVALLPLTTVLATSICHAQTFYQRTNLGGSLGPRVTRAQVVQETGEALFFQAAGGASFLDLEGNRFGFTADPTWQRVTYSKEDDWVRSFDNSGGPGGGLYSPTDVDVTATGYLFVPDFLDERVLIGSFDGDWIYPVGAFSTSAGGPLSAAWDGGTEPFESLDVYLVTGAGTVEFWSNPSGATWSLTWRHGVQGSATNEFLAPGGICVGHSASSGSGTSTFTANFYVADAGNERIVWLTRTSSGALWRRERNLPEGWRPVDCTTDHFGNVYVADEQNSQLVKYTYNLDEITRYGTYGTGENNLNTFAHPHAVHVPFGIKTVGGQNVWYGEGRILTAEDWGPGSGGLEHWLGIEVPDALAWAGTFGVSTDFRTTEHGTVWVRVVPGSHLSGEPAPIRNIYAGLLPPGWNNEFWDGKTASGNNAAAGNYHFHVDATSAYGCSGQAWCRDVGATAQFYWSGGCSKVGCEPPMENVALPLDDEVTVTTLPRSFRLGQALTPYTGPLFRIEGAAGAPSGGGVMRDAEAVASVRAHGITALRVDVPAGDGPAAVHIRIYSLTGRLVRVLLDETVEPGSYLVGWDGLDQQGRRVLPGVYLAHMSAGSYRGVQRLILR